MLYACSAPIGTLKIRDDTSAVLGADHHTIADIQWPGGAKQVVFESEQREALIAIAEAQGEGRPTSTFVSLFRHRR